MTHPSEQPEQLQDPVEISGSHEVFIKGAVAKQFGLSPSNLVIIHDQSYRLERDPAWCGFYVYDNNSNTLYGVVAHYDSENKILTDYKAGPIPL